MRRLMMLALSALAVVGAAVLPSARVLHAADLNLSAASGVAGSTVGVSGSGFTAGNTVVLRWDGASGALLGSATADLTGTFSGVVITIPAGATPGVHTLHASDGSVTVSTNLVVAITPSITVTPANGAAGSIAAVSGTNFEALATVTLRWDSSSGPVVGSAVTDADGDFSNLNITIPTAAETGAHTVVATSGDLTLSAPFTVTAGTTLALSPGSALPGAAITVSGAGYGASAVVTLRWDGAGGAVLATVTAGSGGAFSGASFLVPASSTGAHTVHASDGANSATASLTVLSTTATLTLDPASQVAGGSVTAAGTGFGANETVSLRWDAAGGSVLGTAMADGSGSFSAASLTVPASATLGGHAIVAVACCSSKQAAATLAVTATAPTPESGTLSGKVINASTGSPVSGAEVVLRQRATINPLAPPDNPVVLTTTTDADGEYSLSQIATGIYQLKVSADGYHGTTVSNFAVLAGQTSVINVALRPTQQTRPVGRITGKVTDADTDVGIARALVVAVPDGAPSAGPGRAFGLARTNRDGTYTVYGLRAGTYKLVVLSKGYLPNEVADVQVQAGETATANVTLTKDSSSDDDDQGGCKCNFLDDDDDDDGDDGDDDDRRGKGKGHDKGRGKGHDKHGD